MTLSVFPFHCHLCLFPVPSLCCALGSVNHRLDVSAQHRIQLQTLHLVDVLLSLCMCAMLRAYMWECMTELPTGADAAFVLRQQYLDSGPIKHDHKNLKLFTFLFQAMYSEGSGFSYLVVIHFKTAGSYVFISFLESRPHGTRRVLDQEELDPNCYRLRGQEHPFVCSPPAVAFKPQHWDLP